MTKAHINYLIDVALIILLVFTAITPSLGRYDVHAQTGKAFIGLLIVHIVLHSKWLWCMTKNFCESKEKVCECGKEAQACVCGKD